MSPPETNHAAIERKAFETYILELLRGFATENERVRSLNPKPFARPRITEITMEGEYPDTRYVFRVFRDSSHRPGEQTVSYGLWNSGFFDEKGRPRQSGPSMASDMLMWVGGG